MQPLLESCVVGITEWQFEERGEQNGFNSKCWRRKGKIILWDLILRGAKGNNLKSAETCLWPAGPGGTFRSWRVLGVWQNLGCAGGVPWPSQGTSRPKRVGMCGWKCAKPWLGQSWGLAFPSAMSALQSWIPAFLLGSLCHSLCSLWILEKPPGAWGAY